MEDLFYDSEMINDFEFSEKIYIAGFSNSLVEYLISKNLVWGDLV